MRRGAGLAVAAAVFAGIFGATGAQAATINVPGNNGKSIQDGVDLADPGDTVRIKAKKRSYFENVVVTTNRITLLGVAKKGKRPVIDGSSIDGTTHGVNLDIDADKVSVRNLGFRHGQGIDCTGSGCRFERIVQSMSDQSGDCVEIEGSRGIVRDSTFAGCDDGVLDIEGNGMRVLDNNARAGDNLCMELEGDRARIQGNAVANCEDGGGIQLDGADAVITGNAVRSTDGVGIDLIADGAVIRGNRLRNIEDNGLEIDGTGALIKSNRMSGSGGANDCFEVTGIRQRVVSNRANFCDGGFQVSGENMRVVGNRSVNSGDDAAFDIDCSDEPGGADAADACVNTVIEDNFGADNNNDDEGFEISDFTSDGGLLIRNNVSRDNNDGGFEIDVADSRIVGNTSLRDGAEGNEPGFEIDGDGNRIEKNFASGSGEDGLNVSGLEIVLVRNLVRQSHVDGIHVDSGATDAVLRKNLALGNFADGIENDGTDTDVIENEARGNRRDCVNDGTIDLKQGNRCADGSNFNEPGTVDRRRPRR